MTLLLDAEGLPRSARTAALIVAWLLAASPAFAAAPHLCPTGSPIATFHLTARPIGGGSALPLSMLNVIMPGETLVYEPVGNAFKGNRKAEIGLVLVAADGAPEILPAKPASGHAEWLAPIRASAVGVVLGPRGIDEKKLAALLRKDPSAVDRLADYADETSKVEALVQTLSKFEQSSPATGNSLQSVLNGFSSQYGVNLPPLDRSKPADQQAAALLRAITPAFAINGSARPTLVQQSGGLAASVAALFFGPPAGLAISGLALAGSLHASLLPPTDFRSAFSQNAGLATALCTGGEAPAAGTRLEYVWMLRLPDTDAPTACGIDEAHVPMGWHATLTLRCSSVGHLKALPRVHDWRLVANAHEIPVPAAVTVGEAVDTLAIDLNALNVRPGEYQIAARWDWTALPIAGIVDVRPFGDLSTAAATPESEDRLIAGAGPVSIDLTGADFEFVDRAAIAGAPNLPVPFVLPRGRNGGEQRTATATIDMSRVKPGRLVLQLTQANGKGYDITLPAHAPRPVLQQLPLKANVGEAKQVFDLHGLALERIARLTSPGGAWTLKPLPPGAHDVTEGTAELQLVPGAHAGDRFPVDLVVADLHQPVAIADALEVVGPRPKIIGATASIPGGSGVQLQDRELPAGVPASFVVTTEDAGPHPAMTLACGSQRQVALATGQKSGTAKLDAIGSDSLFLSIDPGSIGPSGCTLTATVSDEATGTSDAYALGRVVRLPRIETFTVGTETLRDSLYAGTLLGEDLETIEKTGWNATSGFPVQGIPTPVPGSPGKQTLAIAVPWPPPSPHAPLYIWLRGEKEGRETGAKY